MHKYLVLPSSSVVGIKISSWYSRSPLVFRDWMCDKTSMNQKKCLKLVFCPFQFCSLFGKEKEISFFIPSTKQAGLVLRNLSFRDIFSGNLALFLCAMFIWMLRDYFSAFVNSLNCGKLIPNNTSWGKNRMPFECDSENCFKGTLLGLLLQED